jgi:hypothetical protein
MAYQDPKNQDWQQPTVRQLKFLVTYAKTKNKTLAAARAWPMAGVWEKRNLVQTTLAMPAVQDRLAQIQGPSMTDSARVHKKLLSATKKVNLGGWIEEVPNDEVRMRAVETAYKVNGLLSSKQDGPNSTTNIQVNNIDPERLAQVVSRLDQISTNLKTKAVPTGEVIDVKCST